MTRIDPIEVVVDTKSPWLSKTYQGIFIAAISSIYKVLAQRFGWDQANGELIATLLQILGGALTAWGLRTAKTPIGDGKTTLVLITPAGTASGNTPISSILKEG